MRTFVCFDCSTCAWCPQNEDLRVLSLDTIGHKHTLFIDRLRQRTTLASLLTDQINKQKPMQLYKVYLLELFTCLASKYDLFIACFQEKCLALKLYIFSFFGKASNRNLKINIFYDNARYISSSRWRYVLKAFNLLRLNFTKSLHASIALQILEVLIVLPHTNRRAVHCCW